MKSLFRRFSPLAIAFHWCHGIPYVVLFTTGTIICLQRMLAREIIEHAVLSLVHRVAGIVLVAVLAQLALLLLYSRGLTSCLRTLRDVAAWRARDLIWFLKIPLNAVFPGFSLPPAGRFNPGQKLNILAVLILLGGFSVSGIFMMIIPGALGAWVIHALLFVPAIALFMLHLFFSLINPPTRKALGCIFTGYVSFDYIASHHPLMVRGGRARSHGSHISWLSAVTVLILFMLFVSGAVWTYGFEQFNNRILTLWKNRGTEIILPGGLCTSHADDPQAHRCRSCHTLFTSLPSAACLSCHLDIVLVMSERSGFHGTLNDECRVCHADHAGRTGDIRRLDSERFNHNLARYPLDGKHRELSCAACHGSGGGDGINERARYINLCFEACTDCHQDPHGDQFLQTCEQCHSVNGWKDRWLVDAHGGETSYPLLGKHAAVECVECHPLPAPGAAFAEARFTGIATSCEGCHDDPHRAEFEAACATCHTEADWKGPGLIFTHARNSSFSIDAIHGGLPCSSCHPGDTTPQYRPLSKTCEGCHRDAEMELQGVVPAFAGRSDPHANRVACTECHRTDVASPSPADYARACGACHNHHYEKLFYDWMKSLYEREVRAAKIAQELRKRNLPAAEMFEAKMREAKAVGLHNVLLARMMWDEILALPSDL